MATLTVSGDAADDVIESTNASWSVCRASGTLAAVGVTAVTPPAVGLAGISPWALREYFGAFDTSALPAGSIITGVALSFHSSDGIGPIAIQVRAFDWGASVTTADWQSATALAALPLVAHGTVSSFSGYTALTDDGFAASINPTGMTRFVVHAAYQLDSADPVGTPFMRISSGNSGNKPQLVITYSPAVIPNFAAVI